MNQSRAITKPQNNKREIRELLESEDFRRKLAATLPRTMSPERFVRIVFQAFHANRDVEKCTQDSLLSCLFKLSAMGLEPDGRRAHLIPFANNKDGTFECTLIVDYKGLKELVRRNHDVSAMHGDIVGENDEFTLRYGTHGILDHVPNLQNRGKTLGAYSWVKLPDGNEEYDWMSIDEIELVRKRSRSPNKGPWVSDHAEMCKKTVFRRHAKGLPLSPQTRDAVEQSDGDALTEAERFNAAVPAKVTVMGGQGRSRMPTGLDYTPDDDTKEQSISEGGPANEESPKEAHVDEAPAASMGTQAQAQTAQGRYLALVGQVRGQLVAGGFSEAELLALMKPLRLAPPKATSLEDCSEMHLGQVVDEWPNVLLRLTQEREAKASQVP